MAISRDRNHRVAGAGQGRAAAADVQPQAPTAEAAIESCTDRDVLIQSLSDIMPGTMPGRRQGAFLMVAIGNLSLVNEAIGFHVGDEVIAIVGARLKGCLRERDCLARYGSNKFGVFLADCEPDQVDFVAGRIFRAVRESVIETTAGAVSITLRVGGILLPQQAKTVQEAFSGALDALDSARSRRGDSFVLFDSSEGRGAQRKRNILIIDEVVRALNERRMVLALQPVVRSGSRKPAFYECLLRMQKQDGTYVSAAEFIPIAEKFGLARLIDHRVVELAVGLLKSAPNLSLSINVSGETAGDGDWLALLRGLVQGDQSLTRRLMVEITETAALTDIEECVGFVNALKKIGCQVAIDDFGAGYSSFKNLRLLDVDMVKIDGSFVRDMANNVDDQFLIRTLVELARNFSMKTVAEWVGDDATACLTEKAGVDFMQGFYFGKPQLIAAGSQEAADTPGQPDAKAAQA